MRSTNHQGRPSQSTNNPHYRVRNDHVDRHGKISLRHAGRRHHLGVGATTQAKL